MAGLMGKTPKSPDPPPIPEPELMPDPEDPNKEIESRKRVARRIAASGRESTFLTKSDKLGGA